MCKCCRRYHQHQNYATKSHHQIKRNCCSPCTPLTPPPSHTSSSPPSNCCTWARPPRFFCNRRTASTCSGHSRCCSALLLPCESTATSCGGGGHYFLHCSDHHLRGHSYCTPSFTSCSMTRGSPCTHHTSVGCVSKSSPHISCGNNYSSSCVPRENGCLSCSGSQGNSRVAVGKSIQEKCPACVSEKDEQIIGSPESPSPLPAPLDQRSEHKVSLFSII